MVRAPRVMFAFWLTLALVSSAAAGQLVDSSLFNGLHWRLAGPFRGGRAVAVTGVANNPEAFYFGSVGGGVWFSGNAGRTWKPIFDKEPVASIGAVAVSESNPNVIYVGSGEADMRSDIQQGKGMYKSVDAGKTWKHIGLTDSRQIGKVVIDPKNPDVVYVAALGHQYGPNEERGVFKTVDGGNTWSKVLYRNADTGAVDLAMDPDDSSVLFASVWQTRRPPWSIYPPSNGPGSGLYKSVDAGASWVRIYGHGFPSKVGRIGLSVSPANHERVFACVDGIDAKDGGVYRSDDGGSTWTHVGTDPRIWGRGWYFMGITADPKNEDVVYVNNTSSYRSVDGGKTWVAFKGAPGGDDNHTLWINPNDNSHMIMGTDQGVIVSVDGGKSWSSWYNQPIGQFYHIVTDNRFPYWIYGSQQDSGAMAIPSRTIHTGISALYQRPIDVGGESGSIAADPLHPGLMYSSTGTKEDFETGWEQNIDPTFLKNDTNWRSEWTQPIVNSGANPKVFYTSHQKVFRTDNGGASWQVISPDLTRKAIPPLANLDPTTAADKGNSPQQGVVYWLGPSPIKATLLWAGTDDGLIWVTQDDGKHWRNVTPLAMTPWSKVGIIEAGHFSVKDAFAAIDRHRVDDNHPYIYITHDGGKTWTLSVDGIPDNQFVNVVREDPKQPGLLYAGTDWGFYVSFNNGQSWQPLQLNLPVASVRDIVFGGNDVIVGTHGRAIWILDDVGMLRQVAGSSGSALFKPDPAVLLQRPGSFGFGLFDEGTPLPPEEPQGENAPWGAVIDYRLNSRAPVVLNVTDAKGRLIRRITSKDPLPNYDPSKMDIPAYWIPRAKGLETGVGGHRYVWDFRYQSAGNALIPPGKYTVKLSCDGKTWSQPLIVRRDPRLPFTDKELQDQFEFLLSIQSAMDHATSARTEAMTLLKKNLTSSEREKLRHATGVGVVRGRRRGPAAATTDTSSLSYLIGAYGSLMGVVGSAPNKVAPEYRDVLARLNSRVQNDQLVINSVLAAHSRP